MKLRWTARATDDLAAIYAYIAQNNPQNARQWIDKLRIRARNAADSAMIGRMVPELGQADIREVFVDHYRIVYRIEADGISILTVFEGHQLLKL
ncbi:type II toxin-antitoxin system RelE/ParE family toxin [Methylomonas sp. OY6]|uniref:Type II toxin-antitoxin system RelE/ParE family toxin n=1 Tax=Methylomonas defluvii TaxID=3045149 RepID=A0ABU4UAV2_9GAMM|nr:type II toxin-antitoxin system RelE/ParE family toxin [Methylomonas sp. OY6]MDX8126543.1 type II toxin-antitoxin system RelE/ParE family toxin [Methylomonas sp. OY6]